MPKDDWIAVPNTHEPIITKDVFEKSVNLMKANYRSSPKKEPELLQGLLICHDCKRKMGISKKDHIGKDGKLYKQYYTQCLYYRRNRHLKLCTIHSVNYFDVENQVLQSLNEICKKYMKLVDFDKLTQQGKEKLQSFTNIYEKKIKIIEKEIADLDHKIEVIYMDRLNNAIGIDTYNKISNKFEEQKEQFQKELIELKENYEDYKNNNTIDNLLETKKIVNLYLKNRKNLTRHLILQLIDHIEIHEDKTIDLFLKIKSLEQIV